MTRKQLNPGWVYCTLVSGVEGNALYINDIRVVGPKPWGGGQVVWERAVRVSSLRESLRAALPESLEARDE